MNTSHVAVAVLELLTRSSTAGEGTPKEQIAKLCDSISAGKTEEGF